MATIEFAADTFNIDATLLGESLGIEPSFVQARMHEGKITSFCERGVGGDAGRYRLTFFYENRRVRFIIDEGGIIILRSMIDFGDRQLPASVRKPGA